MKRNIKIVIVVVVVILIAAILWMRRPTAIETPAGTVDSTPPARTPPAEQTTPPAEEETPQKAIARSEKAPAPETIPEPQVEEEEEEPPLQPGTVRIRNNQTVATINGVVVRGSDLMVFGEASADQPKTMASDSYAQLLDRAIEREAINQAAQKQGIELTESQRGDLERVRDAVLARMAGDPNAVFLNYNGTLMEQAEFEMREAEAQLRLNSLLEKKGVPSPNVTEDLVQQYYQEHQNEFDPLPEDPAKRTAAWRSIDRTIRALLASGQLAAHQAGRRQEIDELKAAAQIDFESVPGAP